MTPRERVTAIINRRPADRIPVDLWTTPEVARDLRQHFRCETDAGWQTAMGLDKIHWAVPGYRRLGMINDAASDGSGRTMWGARTRSVQSGLATYSEVVQCPLAEFTEVRQLDDYPWWPDPEAFAYDEAAQWARRVAADGHPVMGPWISHFEIYCGLRGLEQALADLLEMPEFVEATLDKIEAVQTAMLERYLPMVQGVLDWVFISDDLGMQENLLMSMGTIEAHLLPRLRRWTDLIHSHGMKVMFHTDGAVRPLIPRLIECGVDILNPIQHVCPGMDCAELKREFGRDLIFYGGVENQRILPFGTPDEVREEVRYLLRTLGAGGGFICASCHNVQAGTPVDNILAMVETVHRQGWLG